MRTKILAAAAATLALGVAAPTAGAQDPLRPPFPIVAEPCAPDYPCTPTPHYDPQWPKKFTAWAVDLILP